MKQRIRVVARIRDDVADAREAADQSLGLRAVDPMAGRDRETDRQTERIHRRIILVVRPPRERPMA